MTYYRIVKSSRVTQPKTPTIGHCCRLVGVFKYMYYCMMINRLSLVGEIRPRSLNASTKISFIYKS